MLPLGIALAGLVLGLITLWHTLRRDRVRLRVRARMAVRVPDGEVLVGIEVTNLGGAPVTINAVGLGLGPEGIGFLPRAALADAKTFPQRLEARASLMATIPLRAAQQEPLFARARGVFAQTDCGLTIHSRAGWRGVAQQLDRAAAEKAAQ
jgi:hypothetical protein